MKTRFDKHCETALHAQSVGDLLATMVEFSQERGFERVSATLITLHSPHLTEYQFISNTAPDYRPEFENLSAARIDPVSQHLAKRLGPLVWDQTTYVNADAGDLWDVQAPAGYRSGIAIGLHLPKGRHFLFGPDSDSHRCVAPGHAIRMVEDFLLFAQHAQAAAFYLSEKFDPPSHRVQSLVKTEVDVLRWAMDGLTNWEVGAKLGLTERDVALRLSHAMSKLSCSTKYEAILAAIKLRLIACE